MKSQFKIILMSVFGLFILFGLIAFSTYKNNNSDTSNVEVSVWGTVDSGVFNNFLTKLQQDTKKTLKIKYTQKDVDTLDSELVEAIATGKSPDTVLLPQEFIKRYLDKVYLIDPKTISERTFKDTYIQEAELYLESNGIFAIPFFVNPLVMYWNKDIFSGAGIVAPPSKWSEFPLLAGKLSQSDANANIIKSLASLGEYRNVDNAKALLSTLIMQAGNPIVSSDGSGGFVSSLDTKQASDIMNPSVSALRFYTDYSNPKKSVYSWNRSLPSSKQFFLSEDLSIYFGLASEYGDISVKNPNLNFDVAVIPQTVDSKTKMTFGELYGFAILKNSPNIVPAFNLISYLTGVDSVPTFLQFVGGAPARKDLISLGSTDSAKSIFYSSAIISKGWIDPDMNKTDKIFQNMVEDITTGKLDIENSVKKASGDLNNLLTR
jgi:multiple sugar transport system substrate-binding protein